MKNRNCYLVILQTNKVILNLKGKQDMMSKTSFSFVLLLSVFMIAACSRVNGDSFNDKDKPTQEELSKLSKAYFASGCFWCVEAIFESVNGVAEAVSGYAGGEIKNPTYQQVSAGKTKHAEAVEVYYDSSVVSFETLVKVFFGSHDPTTLNRQGPDAGPHYRSVAFYQNEAEKQIIEAQIEALNRSGYYNGKIVTEVTALDIFYPAEDYHQDYEKRNPYNSYLQLVSIPRLNKFKEKFPELLKKEAMAH